MPRTISDEEDRYLQDRRNVADFVESIYNDPQLNKDAKRLIKRKFPNLSIPDLDLEDQFNKRLADEKHAKEAEAKAAREKKEDEEFQAERRRVKKEYGFTDEAMKTLEKLMYDKKIGDYDVAASYMAAKEPKASEPQNESRFWRHEQQEGFADIAKDPEKWAEKEIVRAIRADEAAAARGWK